MPKTNIITVLRVIEHVCNEFIDSEDRLSVLRVKDIVSGRLGVPVGKEYLADRLVELGWCVERSEEPWIVTR